MARLFLAVAVGVLASFLMSCSKKTTDEHITEAPTSEKLSVHYDSGVPSTQKDLLEGDFENLSRLKTGSTNAEQAQILGLGEISGPALNNWLRERTKVFVGQDFEVNSRITYQQRFSGTTQVFEQYTPLSAATTNAENTGGRAYLKCKPLGYLCSLSLMDGTSIEVRTPRIGVVRIGEGLFSSRIEGEKSERAASFVRLGTIFHEAGHTNGNGEHACFPHAKCPYGHNYYDPDENKGYACDLATNGPYPIGVSVLNILYEACGSNCTTRQKEQMRAIIADYETRLLVDSGASYKDPRPERIP